MTAFAVHDWRFDPERDVQAAMAAASRYVKAMKSRELFVGSFWSRTWQDAFRHFHVPVYPGTKAMEAAFSAGESDRFVEDFYPHVDDDGVRAAKCVTVLSSGGAVPAVPGAGTDVTLVVNDFTFTSEAGAERGMQAAEEYVKAFAARKGMLLSLWGREIESPLRFFHVNVLDRNATAGAARQWPETHRFAEALFPNLDPASVEQPFTDVVLATASETAAEPLVMTGHGTS